MCSLVASKGQSTSPSVAAYLPVPLSYPIKKLLMTKQQQQQKNYNECVVFDCIQEPIQRSLPAWSAWSTSLSLTKITDDKQQQQIITKVWSYPISQSTNPLEQIRSNSLPYESSAKSLVKPGPMVLIQRFLNGLAWDHFGLDLEVRGWVLSQVLEWTSTALLELVTCKDDVRDAYGISE